MNTSPPRNDIKPLNFAMGLAPGRKGYVQKERERAREEGRERGREGERERERGRESASERER